MYIFDDFLEIGRDRKNIDGGIARGSGELVGILQPRDDVIVITWSNRGRSLLYSLQPQCLNIGYRLVHIIEVFATCGLSLG